MTTSVAKAEKLKTMPEAKFDHYIVTNDHHGEMRHWHKDIRILTKKHGVDVFFDPVAAGAYLDMEINSIAQHGTVWVYGLLGTAGKVDVTPLIRKFASVRGWYLKEITDAGATVLQQGYDYIFDGFKKGIFQQHVAQVFPLDKVQDAHRELALGRHIGKMILVP
jgi:NADPH:quinone reductase-like Zn-dependent oxidoreductase